MFTRVLGAGALVDRVLRFFANYNFRGKIKNAITYSFDSFDVHQPDARETCGKSDGRFLGLDRHGQ